jgi:hypothetical protein
MNEETVLKLRYVDKTLEKAERLLRRAARLLDKLGQRIDRVIHFAGVDPRRFGIDRLFRTLTRIEDGCGDIAARLKRARDTVTDLLNEPV